jgi:hypothetical protein
MLSRNFVAIYPRLVYGIHPRGQVGRISGNRNNGITGKSTRVTKSGEGDTTIAAVAVGKKQEVRKRMQPDRFLDRMGIKRGGTKLLVSTDHEPIAKAIRQSCPQSIRRSHSNVRRPPWQAVRKFDVAARINPWRLTGKAGA